MSSKDKAKILLLWYMKGDNFGDVLIYDTVSTFLKDNGYEVEVHEVGDDITNIFEHANRCDFLLFAGGGIVERYLPPVIRLFKDNYDKLSVPYGVMGFGMGEFDYTIYKSIFAFWVEKSEFFYVRDIHTKKTLDLFVQIEKVVYSADCVFANRRIQEFRHERRMKHGINIRELPYKDLTGDFNWEQMGRIVKEIGCDCVIPDSNNEINKISNYVKIDFDEFVMKPNNSMEKIIYTTGIISQCEWIVAMRYHVVLVAAMFGIVTVPILYCPKVRFLAQQLDLLDLAVEIDDIGMITDKMILLQKNYARYEKHMNESVVLMKHRADEMFLEIKEYLKDKLRK